MESPTTGKTLSTEHINKISLSTATTKRSKNPNLTNEKIREIYEGKTKLYNFEFSTAPPISYEKYLEIIGK